MEVCASTEMDAPSASHLGMGDHGPKTDRSRPRSVPVNALAMLKRWVTTSRLLITDPHVPIWITSSLRTAREIKHVPAEVAARLAEHLGEGGPTKRELDVLQLIRDPHRNKHVYPALSVRRHLVKLASHAPSIPRHATR